MSFEVIRVEEQRPLYMGDSDEFPSVTKATVFFKRPDGKTLALNLEGHDATFFYPGGW